MVALLDEPILLVNDREVGEYLDGFMPSRVHRLILCRCDCKKLGKLHSKSNRHISILTDNAPMLDTQQGEL